MKAEARKAEFVARAAMLKKKQELEQEEHQKIKDRIVVME